MKCTACATDNAPSTPNCTKCGVRLSQEPAMAPLVPEYGAQAKKKAQDGGGSGVGVVVGIVVFQGVIVPQFFPSHPGFDLTRIACAGLFGAAGGVLGHWIGKLAKRDE